MQISRLSNFNKISFNSRNKRQSTINSKNPDEFAFNGKIERIEKSNIYNKSLLAGSLLALIGGGALTAESLTAPSYEYDSDVPADTREALTQIIKTKEKNYYRSAYTFTSEKDDTELSIIRNKREISIKGRLNGEEISLKMKDNSGNNDMQTLFGLMVTVLSGFAAKEARSNLKANKEEEFSNLYV